MRGGTFIQLAISGYGELAGDVIECLWKEGMMKPEELRRFIGRSLVLRRKRDRDFARAIDIDFDEEEVGVVMKNKGTSKGKGKRKISDKEFEEEEELDQGGFSLSLPPPSFP